MSAKYLDTGGSIVMLTGVALKLKGEYALLSICWGLKKQPLRNQLERDHLKVGYSVPWDSVQTTLKIALLNLNKSIQLQLVHLKPIRFLERELDSSLGMAV